MLNRVLPHQRNAYSLNIARRAPAAVNNRTFRFKAAKWLRISPPAFHRTACFATSIVSSQNAVRLGLSLASELVPGNLSLPTFYVRVCLLL